MTVNHVIFQTPFGSAAMVYTCAPFQLQKVYLPRQSNTDLIQDIEQDFLISQNGYHSHIDVLIKRLQHYFCGHPITTPWKWLSWQKRTPLQIKTLKETALIPFGEVCSYQQLAKKIGRPKATRFVGSCMARNPFPIFIPCHRVIRSDGTLGCFGGGSELKQTLLNLESNETISDRSNPTGRLSHN